MVAAFVKEICNVLGTTMHGLCVSMHMSPYKLLRSNGLVKVLGHDFRKFMMCEAGQNFYIRNGSIFKIVSTSRLKSSHCEAELITFLPLLSEAVKPNRRKFKKR